VGVTQEETELLAVDFADYLETMAAVEVRQIAEYLVSATAHSKDD